MCKNYETGRLGENIATAYLKQNNYEIITRNFRCRQGEIDIIAKIKNVYIFIEVKARTSLQYGRPAEAVNNIKKQHIKRATEYYLYKNRLENCNIRFDIIEILIKCKKFKLNHIKQI